MKLANGEVYLGEKSIEIGLVDEIGDYSLTIEEIKNVTGYKDALVIDYSPKKTFLDYLELKNLFNFKTNSNNLVMM